MNYVLIPVTNLDFDFAYQLKKVAYKEYIEQTWGWDEDFQMKFHEENFSTANTKIVIVEGRRIGTVDLKEEDERTFISGLYLLPAFQNKGIGTAILRDIMQETAANKKRIELEVLKVNTKAQDLYKRLGFEMSEGDETKYLMYKEYSKGE